MKKIFSNFLILLTIGMLICPAGVSAALTSPTSMTPSFSAPSPEEQRNAELRERLETLEAKMAILRANPNLTSAQREQLEREQLETNLLRARLGLSTNTGASMPTMGTLPGFDSAEPSYTIGGTPNEASFQQWATLNGRDPTDPSARLDYYYSTESGTFLSGSRGSGATPPGFVSESSPVGGGAGGSGGAGAAGGQMMNCSIGAILAQLLQAVIGGLVGVATALVSPEVTVADQLKRAKESGIGILGIPILPSWDALAQCLGNIIIAYLSQAALQFAQAGLNGNSAFLDQPLSGFLGGLQDQVLNDFAGSLMYQSRDPYVRSITQSLVSQNVQPFAQTLAQQTLGNNQRGLAGFQGAYQNNYMSTYNMVNNQYDQLARRATNDAQTQLNWGSGYFPVTQNGRTQVPGNTVGQTILSQGILLPLANTLFSKLDSNGFASLTQFLELAVNQIVSKVLTPKNQQQQGGARVTDTTSKRNQNSNIINQRPASSAQIQAVQQTMGQ